MSLDLTKLACLEYGRAYCVQWHPGVNPSPDYEKAVIESLRDQEETLGIELLILPYGVSLAPQLLAKVECHEP